MARPTYGQLQEFQPETENVTAYLERMDMYLLANQTPEARQVPVFLSSVGGKTFALLRDLLAPSELKSQTLKTLYDTLKAHYEPTPLVIAERFYFHQRSQGPSESVAEYVAELRRLTIHCKFGDFLSDALRDRLVCGLRNASSQKILLAEKDLSLKRAIEIAQASEAAEYNAKKLQATDSAPPVYRTEFRPERKGLGQERECYRCGGMGHHASACRFKDANCKKRGHLARVCRGNRPGRGQRQNEDSRRRQQPLARENVHNVDRELGPGEDQPRPPSDDETMFTMFRVGGNPQTPMVVTMEVNGKLLTMEVDTGAAVSVISTATRDQMFPDCPLINTSAVLTTYTGERMPLAGEIKEVWGTKGSTYTVCGGRCWAQLAGKRLASKDKARLEVCLCDN